MHTVSAHAETVVKSYPWPRRGNLGLVTSPMDVSLPHASHPSLCTVVLVLEEYLTGVSRRLEADLLKSNIQWKVC